MYRPPLRGISCVHFIHLCFIVLYIPRSLKFDYKLRNCYSCLKNFYLSKELYSGFILLNQQQKWSNETQFFPEQLKLITTINTHTRILHAIKTPLPYILTKYVSTILTISISYSLKRMTLQCFIGCESCCGPAWV